MSSSNRLFEDTRKEGDRLLGTLLVLETKWRDRCLFLESQGYRLRPRLRPDWEPSWRKTGGVPMFAEDSLHLFPRPNLVDATRIRDGILVYIKRITTGDNESLIAQFLSSEELRKYPRNHSVPNLPIIDYFQDSDDEAISYLVMPFLRSMNSPEFGSIEEVLNFGDQLFEGLVFMHEHGVAHRDCSEGNIMMDASAMYREGFHPISTFLDPTYSKAVSYYTRSERPVKYYYIDFGLLVYIPPEHHPKLALGVDGRDGEVPELSNTIPYDPFKADMFIIGNMFKREFFLKYSNVDFLIPLIVTLTQTNPDERPDAQGALKIWKEVRQSVSYLDRIWRLREREDGPLAVAAWDAASFLRRSLRLSQWAPSVVRM